MAVRKWTKEEDEAIVDVMNDYPGNFTYGSVKATEYVDRSANAILIRFRKIKKDYNTPCVVSGKGKKTPNGVTRWNSDAVPEITTIRRWQNIKHLFFN